MSQRQWWRDAVIYQVYPRSFMDSNNDGMGDLPGVTSRLDDLAYLGVDAVWLSPFYPSPGNDAGYDVANYVDIDPLFGNLEDFDALLAGAHERGMKVIVDLVPNHTSSAHLWFQEALEAEPGSPERDRYIFRDGRGKDGEEPPNNWLSLFGGSAWTRTTNADGTPGQWYLHLFDSSQPDLNWENPWVREQFERILRFWLDRGVDGFRVDVAHGLGKKAGLPDWSVPEGGTGIVDEVSDCPYFAQPQTHEIFRQWRKVLDQYPGERILCAEAWVEPLSELALWVRPDEMHQAFNFTFLTANWDAARVRKVIQESLDAFSSVGAPATWVLSNHDTIRHATRLGMDPVPEHGVGVGPKTSGVGSEELGLARARAATLMMLGLPGCSYLYQGEELGLPEVINLPNEARQDPSWHRGNGDIYGRDGCRVPLPWDASTATAGFNEGSETWLPQPEGWEKFAREVQKGDHDSTLEMYRSALKLRKEFALGDQELAWIDLGENAVAFKVGKITVVANYGNEPVELPEGEILIASKPLDNAKFLPADSAVWILS